MNKYILISINPEYVKDILNGNKILELRKTMPKCALPIDVYIYCTQSNKYLLDHNLDGWFCWDKQSKEYKVFNDFFKFNELFNGHVVAKFTLNKVEKIPYKLYPSKSYLSADEYDIQFNYYKDIMKKACIEKNKFIYYQNKDDLYGWYINNLHVFVTPLNLRDFYKSCKDYYGGFSGCDEYCGSAENGECLGGKYPINVPPMSWQFVYK